MNVRPRVVLEPLMRTHAAELFAILRDRRLWRYTEQTAPASERHLAQRFERLEARRSPDGGERWLNWAIRWEASVVGFVQATVRDESAEVAYVVGLPYQRRGIAQAALAAMLADLEEAYAIGTFGAVVDARNLASRAVLERCGFRCVDASDECNLRFARDAR